MPANKIIQIAPVTLSLTTTTNILNCTVTSFAGPVGFALTAIYLLVRSIRVVNRTNIAAACALWKGATGANAAGTEWVLAGSAAAGALTAGTGVSVPAQGSIAEPDWKSVV